MTPRADAHVVVTGLGKDFANRDGSPTKALDNVNLSVAQGEFASIVGPSGCGKSTLLYILGGFIQASRGHAYAGGKRIVGPSVDRGVVFQEYALFPWLTVQDNIAYGLRRKGLAKDQVHETVQRYLHLAHLDGFADSYPRELSGGMRQRVALARTFACSPGILLLDEPFGALDAQTKENMQDELLQLWESSGSTVIMVTHDIAEAVYLSDTVHVMSRRPGTLQETFAIPNHRGQPREQIVLSDGFNHIRNDIWLAVRAQVSASAPEALA